jgi:hypothetical protein
MSAAPVFVATIVASVVAAFYTFRGLRRSVFRMRRRHDVVGKCERRRLGRTLQQGSSPRIGGRRCSVGV